MGTRHALWLLPEEPARARLAVLIEEIASAEGTARFAPHVTLLSGLTLDRDALLARARHLAGGLPPVPVRLGAPAHSAEFYRAVVLGVEGEAMGSARARAEEALDARGGAAFRPHLSLVYGLLSEPARRRIVAGLGERGSGPCTLDTLEAVATDGPPEGWVPLGRWPLRRESR